jgi:DNA polymerase alpha subunit B
MEWMAFPQPPLGSGLNPNLQMEMLMELGLEKIPQVSLFPNPVQFQINETLWAISNLDVLLPMNGACASNGPAEMDRISQQFQHLISQRSFYPLFPPAEHANLDSIRALLTMDEDKPGPAQLAAKPDFLIVPSKIKACTKHVGNTLCINPGPLVKGKAGGTFAKIVLHPFDFDDDSNDLVLEHSVPARTRVEIARI